MTRYFMRDTPLYQMEQMMMTPPHFKPRGHGLRGHILSGIRSTSIGLLGNAIRCDCRNQCSFPAQRTTPA